MRYRLLLCILSLLTFSVEPLSAQNVPAAYASLIKGKEKKQQVVLLDSVAATLRKENPSLCIAILKSAIRLASTYELDTVEIQERMNLNRQYRFAGSTDSAMLQIDSALNVAKLGKLPEWEGEILAAKGVLQTRMGYYEEANATYLEGLELAKSINDSETVAQLNKNWAAMFFYTADFEAAVDRTQEALKIFLRMNDSNSVAGCLDNIGLYYSNMEQWDSTRKYQLKALAIFEAQRDSNDLLICYNNIGSTMIRLDDYAAAKTYLDKALSLAERKKLKYEQMTVLSTMAELYHATGDAAAEQETSLRVYNLALEQENNFYALDAAATLAHSYYGQKNFERSAYYFGITDSLRQLVFDSEKTDAVREAEEKYKSNERKQQIALLEADNQAQAAQAERDQIFKWAVSGFVIVLLIFSVFVVSSYLRKKRDNTLLQHQNEAIEEQKLQIETKNEEITDSINYAMRIQTAVLPATEKVNALFPENFIYYRPRDIISGDFYWAAEGVDDVRYLAVADCTGHGVPGAMMSMLGSSILNRLISKEHTPTPGEILDALHDELLLTLNATHDSRKVNDGMDIAVMMYDVRKRKVIIASADRPVYYVQSSQFNIIDPDKISIGSALPKTAPYREHELPVENGISIYLFSDGITDQFGGPDRKKFMSKRLKNLVQENDHLEVLEKEKLFRSVFEKWKYGMEQTDDMTLINIKIT